MTQFDGLANLLLELLAELIKAIKEREVGLLGLLGEVLLDVHNLLGGKATPEGG